MLRRLAAIPHAPDWAYFPRLRLGDKATLLVEKPQTSVRSIKEGKIEGLGIVHCYIHAIILNISKTGV